jgi:hypothetical protein
LLEFSEHAWICDSFAPSPALFVDDGERGKIGRRSHSELAVSCPDARNGGRRATRPTVAHVGWIDVRNCPLALGPSPL